MERKQVSLQFKASLLSKENKPLLSKQAHHIYTSSIMTSPESSEDDQ